MVKLGGVAEVPSTKRHLGALIAAEAGPPTGSLSKRVVMVARLRWNLRKGFQWWDLSILETARWPQTCLCSTAWRVPASKGLLTGCRLCMGSPCR